MKPWRYCRPDDFRDTVLARLLELNKKRAEQDKPSGETVEEKSKEPHKRKPATKGHGNQLGLFD